MDDVVCFSPGKNVSIANDQARLMLHQRLIWTRGPILACTNQATTWDCTHYLFYAVYTSDPQNGSLTTSLSEKVGKNVPRENSMMLQQINMTDSTTTCDRSIATERSLETSAVVAALDTVALSGPFHAVSAPPSSEPAISPSAAQKNTEAATAACS